MRIDRSLSDEFAILTLKGEFDTFYVPQFLEEIDGVINQELNHVILNMRQVKFANSTAIGAMIKAHKRCRAEDGELIVAEPSKFVSKVLDALGIGQLIQVFDDEKAARKTVVQILNKREMADAPVQERVMITFDDDTRNQQVSGFTKGVSTSSLTSGRRTLVGRMGNVSDERIQFTWSGERFGLSAGQAAQLFFVGGEAGLKFSVKLCKKGYFVSKAKVVEAVEDGDHAVKVTAAFLDMDSADRDALGQYAQDMEFLKRQLPGG